MTVLPLAVERDVFAFDLVFQLHAPQERRSMSAEFARSLHIAVSAGMPAVTLHAETAQAVQSS